MMDQKSWLWKKRSTEKTLVADKGNNSFAKNEEVTEIQQLQTDKTELERDLRTLEGKLCAALSECSAKDNIAKKQVKIAEEAIAGWERAEIQANSLKQELENILQQKASSEERIHHLDAALKECMQQLRFLRDEQEKRVHGAVIKTTEAFEKVRIASDEKLAEANRRLTKLDGENAQLVKALSEKDKVIEDLRNYRTRLETDFNSLMSRVKTTEKENSSLKYEICVLEKELDIRNEEREFNRRRVEVSQKQHVENAKKIGKLEMECQRLRVLVRKRLPGPAALVKMKSEVEVLGKHQVEVTPGSTVKRIDVLTQQLHKMEEENKALKDVLINTEAQVEDPNKHSQFLPECSLEASSDVGGSDDKASCAESWASALISELEHFKNEKYLGTAQPYRSMGTSEIINLMDDFAEMEKIAIASSDCPSGSTPKQSEQTTVDKASQCLGDLVKMLLDHSLALQRNPRDILEDMKLALEESESKNGSKKSRKLPPTAIMSIHKILDLIEGLNMQSQNNQDSENTAGYIVRAFQWKTGELSAVLQQLVLTCNDLLNGTADLDQFAQQVASNLEWVVNHCFSIQDVSSMKDAIRSRFDWDELMSDGEVECNSNVHMETKSESPLADNLELMARSEIAHVECIGIQTDEQKMMQEEDLEACVSETNDELKKAYEKITCLEDELENKNSLCKRLEQTCQELNTKLERMTSKEIPENKKHSEMQIETDWEITAASEKLAECQETILNLGKQLKALATPSDAALFDKVISNAAEPPPENAGQRSSLLEKMLAEDKDDKIATSPTPKPCTQNINATVEPCGEFTDTNGIVSREDRNENKTAPSMDIVPCKKKGGWSVFRKMFWRRKRSS